MRLINVSVNEALGYQVAHSQMGHRNRLPKASMITQADILDLIAAGIDTLDVIVPDDSDVSEEVVADRLVDALTWTNCETKRANGGRYNIYASCDGLLCFDRAMIDGFNAICEDITLATRLPQTPVKLGDHIATLKIIPFFVQNDNVELAESAMQIMEVAVRPWRNTLRVELIQTRNGTVSSKIQDKALEIQTQRLAFYGIDQLHEYREQHRIEDLAIEITKASARKTDILLILGASAICDRSDIVPSALAEAGGSITYFGMPVDPGNLMLIGALGSMTVIGMPGCVRSPAFNGLDLVLDRLVAGLDVMAADIQAMGVGGLLKTFPSRLNRPATNTLELSA